LKIYSIFVWKKYTDVKLFVTENPPEPPQKDIKKGKKSSLTKKLIKVKKV
jgi:hypothetical protein